MSALWVLLQIGGALGVFLLGMKLLSESLQKVSGSRLKQVLSAITSNRFSGVFAGILTTAIVQSSSATTVMVVGFVTAELLTLTQAISVVMGANIGTTLTGWLVALLGFKVKVTMFALPAVGVGTALTFLPGAKRRQIGEVLVGFGLLFIGLGLLKESVPTLSGTDQLTWIADISGFGIGSAILMVGVGTALTVILQSSSATMTLTLTLAASGVLPYELAAAMVLGENIGTTATANLAAIGTPAAARRAARAHLLFNTIGVIWALALYQLVLLPVVDFLVPGDPLVDFTKLDGEGLATATLVVTAHLAAFHSLFNVTNTLIMLPFVNHIARLVTRWIPDDAKDAEMPPKFLDTPLAGTPELQIVRANSELRKMASIACKMFSDTVKILTDPSADPDALVSETLRREQVLDEYEHHISAHLAMTARLATSADSARKIAELIQNTHRLERLGDHCAVLVRISQRLREDGRNLTEREQKDLASMGAEVTRAIANLQNFMDGTSDLQTAEAIEDDIDERRRTLRAEQLGRIEQGVEDIQAGLALLDLLTSFEEIGDLAVGFIRRASVTRTL